MNALEEKLVVGAKIKIGQKYADEIKGFDAGEVIVLIEGYFEHDNGMYTENQVSPAIWNESTKEFDSTFHLFGNDFEYWYDCEILPE